MAVMRSAQASLPAPAGAALLPLLPRRLLGSLVLLGHGALLLALWLAHGDARPGDAERWAQDAPVLQVQLLASAGPPAGERSQPMPFKAPPPPALPRMAELPMPVMRSASLLQVSPVPRPTALATSTPAEPPVASFSGRADADAAMVAPAAVQEAMRPAPARAPFEAPPAPLRLAQADHRHCPPAAYPALLRERGVEGAVLLRVRVDASGQPSDVQLLSGSGFRLFDEAALRQVRGCRFIPAARGDEYVESWVEFPVRFALEAS